MEDPPDLSAPLLSEAQQNSPPGTRPHARQRANHAQEADRTLERRALGSQSPATKRLTAAASSIAKLPCTFWGNGLACAAVAHFVFSCSALFIKLTAGRIPVLEVAVFRSAVSFVLSMITIAANRMAPVFGHRRNMHLLLMRGISGSTTMVTYYASLFLLPLGDAVTLNQLKPPVTAIVAWLFLGEPLGWQGVLGCLVSLCGVVFLAHPPFLFGGNESWSHERLMGTILGVISPISAAGVGYSTRRIGKSEPAVVVALWFHMCTLVGLLPPLILGWPDKAVIPSAKDTLYLLGVAVTSFMAQILQTRGFQLTLAARAAAVGFTQVIYGHTFGAMFFGERPTLLSLIGTALIVLGVAIVAIRPRKKDKVEPCMCLDCDALLPPDPPPVLEPLLPVSGEAEASSRPEAAITFKRGADELEPWAGKDTANYEPPVLIPARQASDVVVHISSQRSSSESSPTAISGSTALQVPGEHGGAGTTATRPE